MQNKPLDDDELDAVMKARWAVADNRGATKVEDIPLPWKHSWGTIIAIEYPPDRPRVVDLVFEDGDDKYPHYKTAETKNARYMQNPDGVWVYPEEVA